MNTTASNPVIIFGGSGFVGTNFCNLLKRNKRRFVIGDLVSSEKYPNQTEILDVRDNQSLQKLNDCETLVNLAAVHRDDVNPVSLYDETNVHGAKVVCDFAREKGVNRIIFTSSVAIYGFAPPETSEDGEPNYFNDYGRTKYLAEAVYMRWLEEDPKNRSLVIVRPTVIFGEGNRGNVYNLLRQIAKKRFVMFGNGRNRKSMAYVENVAAFLQHCLGSKPGVHIYNYVDKPDFDMNSLVSVARKVLFKKEGVGIRQPASIGIGIGYMADAVTKITGKTLPVSSIRVKKFMGTTQFASAANETGFVPPVPLEEGLARTLRYEFLEDNSDKQTFDTE